MSPKDRSQWRTSFLTQTAAKRQPSLTYHFNTWNILRLEMDPGLGVLDGLGLGLGDGSANTNRRCSLRRGLGLKQGLWRIFFLFRAAFRITCDSSLHLTRFPLGTCNRLLPNGPPLLLIPGFPPGSAIKPTRNSPGEFFATVSGECFAEHGA
jgi:hypothetical protein